MKIDLHCHSHFSDGKHSPDFLLQLALRNQVTHLAITDHDCLAAFTNLEEAYPEIELIQGIEVSCDWEGREIHVVGLFIDIENPALVDFVNCQLHKRTERINAINHLLQDLGDYDLLSYLDALPCHAYTRSHVADFLVAEGICKSRQKVFKTHLGKRGKLHVPATWPPLGDAVNTINEAGGVAVLAHPGRYPLGKAKLESLIDDFIAGGGEGLEVSYSNIDNNTKSRLCQLAREKSLYASMGSDFHDAAAHWTTLGKIPAVDSKSIKNAIWEHPRWRS